MATVRFSGDLQIAIMHNAGTMFSKKITAAEEKIPESWGRTVYDLAFKEHKEAMRKLPPTYFRSDSSISLVGFRGEGWDRALNRSIQMPLGEKRPFPIRLEASGHGMTSDGRVYGGWELDAADMRWAGFKLEYADYSRAVQAVVEQKQKFCDGVKKIITTYSTLAPALKAWPPLWDLIPDHKQEAHKKITDRKRAAPTVEGVDLGALTAVSALAKLMGGK